MHTVVQKIDKVHNFAIFEGFTFDSEKSLHSTKGTHLLSARLFIRKDEVNDTNHSIEANSNSTWSIYFSSMAFLLIFIDPVTICESGVHESSIIPMARGISKVDSLSLNSSRMNTNIFSGKIDPSFLISGFSTSLLVSW